MHRKKKRILKIFVTANAQSDGFEVNVTSQKMQNITLCTGNDIVTKDFFLYCNDCFETILIDDLPTRLNVAQGRYLCEANQARRRDSSLLA